MKKKKTLSPATFRVRWTESDEDAYATAQRLLAEATTYCGTHGYHHGECGRGYPSFAMLAKCRVYGGHHHTTHCDVHAEAVPWELNETAQLKARARIEARLKSDKFRLDHTDEDGFLVYVRP